MMSNHYYLQYNKSNTTCCSWLFRKVLGRHYRAALCCCLTLWSFGLIAIFGVRRETEHRSFPRPPPGAAENVSEGLPGTFQVVSPPATTIPNIGSLLVKEYCNRPHDGRVNKHPDGEEGVAPTSTYTLRSVHVLIRHGDRASLRAGHTLTNVHCGYPDLSAHPLLYNYTRHITALRGRMPHTGPFSKYPLTPYGTRCAPGQLTNIGVHQHLLTGDRLRRAYLNRWSLLGDEHLSPGPRVRVISTVYARTYQSALAFLYSFLGPDHRHHIPDVRVEPSLNIRFCDGTKHGAVCRCPTMEKYRSAVDRDNQKRLAKHYALKDMVRNMNNVLGFTNKTDMMSPLATFDLLMAFACHQANPPCRHSATHQRRCILHHEIYKLTSFLMNTSLFSDAFQRYSHLKIFPLLQEIVLRMREQSDQANADQPRFVLYSGHDVTLSPLIATLGFHEHYVPPYASLVALELYEAKHDGENYVRVVYNGRDKTRRVKFCKDDITQDGMCPLGLFSDFVEHGFLQFMNTTSYQKACTARVV